MYTCQELVLLEPGETTDWRKSSSCAQMPVGKGKMETIEEHRAHHGSINLVILKTEIVSALSAVGSATSIEELRQADAAYKKALCTARGMGYRPHIRAGDGQQIQVEWVALGKATFCEGHANIARQVPTTSKRERR
jgi:hypothetical protein